MVVDDIIAALDSGTLGGLVTDVTDPEPLPEDSLLWTHPKVCDKSAIAFTVIALLQRLEVLFSLWPRHI